MRRRPWRPGMRLYHISRREACTVIRYNREYDAYYVQWEGDPVAPGRILRNARTEFCAARYLSPRPAGDAATHTQRACSACARVVAVRRLQQNHGGGKHMARHKCPHGRWCIAGDRFSNNGWNAGDLRHRLRCPECAAGAAR
jgi:hypothetical protein